MKWQRLYGFLIRRLVPPVSVMVVVLLLVLMYLVSESLQRANQPEKLYLALLGASAVGLLFLFGVVLGPLALARVWQAEGLGVRTNLGEVLAWVATFVGLMHGAFLAMYLSV